MDDSDFRIFSQHVAKHVPPDCPVCKKNDWQAAGPVDYGASDTLLTGTQVIPVVMLICRNCFFVLHFAWKPIEKEAGNG